MIIFYRVVYSIHVIYMVERKERMNIRFSVLISETHVCQNNNNNNKGIFEICSISHTNLIENKTSTSIEM